MAQTAPKLRLVEAPSTGYARKAWISHVIATAPEAVGGVDLAVLKELADLVDDATGWAEASYEKLARRTRFAVKTVRNAVRKLKGLGLIAPELVGKRSSPTGQGRDRLRYHFPAMHAFLAERKARRAAGCAAIPPRDRALPDGGRSDHGQSDHGTRPRPTLVSEGQNPPPLEEPKNQEPCAPAREGLDLAAVLRKLRGRVPRPLADAVEASAPELHGRTLVLWMPGRLETVLRAQEAALHAAAGIGLRLRRAGERARPGAPPWPGRAGAAAP